MECYLISGLGPVHLDYYDIRNTVMDPNSDQKKLKELYTLDNGVLALPQNLTHNGTPLLRKSNYLSVDLTTSTLSQILSHAVINHTLLPISKIWNDEKFHCANSAIVCLSTTFIWNDQMFEKALKWISNSFSQFQLIVGGQYATLKGEQLLNKYSCIAYMIIGDGEIALPEIIKYILSGDKKIPKQIPNLMFYYNGKIYKTDPLEVKLEDILPLEFEGNQIAIPYASMRGCPYSCKFCAQSTTSSFRWLSVNRVYEDWKRYKEKNNIEYINISDSTFFIPFSRIEKLLDKITPLCIKWEANLRADTPLTPEMVRKLEDSGCYEVAFGFESMSEKTLHAINKKTTSAQNRRMNELFRNSAIDPLMSFIVGFPGETPEEFQKTSNYLINEHYGHFSVYVFEMENSSVPIWDERDKYSFELVNENLMQYEHMGRSWKHCGMTSKIATQLRNEVISKTRTTSECNAIFYSWQRNYQWPFINGITRQKNLEIEKLIDRLIFASVDFPTPKTIRIEIRKILKQLSNYGIVPKNSTLY